MKTFSDYLDIIQEESKLKKMKSKWILIDSGRIEFEGDFNFSSDNYVGKVLATSAGNLPRRVVSDKLIDGVRVLELEPLN